jgi:hypothetical protein
MLDPAGDFRVSINRARAPESSTPETESTWERLLRENPRLHDGPIVAVERAEAPINRLRCRIDTYKRLVAQPEADVWMLGVKGWVVGRDPSGAQYVLIARRGTQTRMYGGMWENAPAGGVEPPRDERTDLHLDWLIESLSSEATEELGISADWSAARPVALLRDHNARSYDLVLGIDLPGAIDPGTTPRCEHGSHAWEYIDAAWLARADAPALLNSAARPTSPPLKTMLRLSGWT